MLDLKIPPPIVAILCGLGIVYLPDLFKLEAFEIPLQGWVAGVVIVFGLSFDLMGLLEFRKHATTISPLSPNKTALVVSSGIYRITRNPMYLGMAIVLVGVTIAFGSAIGLLMVLVFVLYITRFQIKPEERILEAKFGEAFVDYKAKVKRWI
jgi:protein-S-isoprenylcysteine O-methyltransferase Ste14